jgi:hypothetical protein
VFPSDDFDLPKRAPMWRRSRRVAWHGTARFGEIHAPSLETAPHARLVCPTLPRGAWLVEDTAVVQGRLTLHRTGRVTFAPDDRDAVGIRARLVKAVASAMERSACVPATAHGERVDVTVRYRCVFVRGGASYAYFEDPAAGTAIVKTD